MSIPLYDQAVRLLARRAHGRQELGRKLRRKGASQSEVEKVLDRLEARGYLNDAEFAYLRALRRRQVDLWGNFRISLDLKRLGVSARIVELTLLRVETEHPEEEALGRLVSARIGARGRPETPAQLKNLFDHCVRLGHPPERVRDELSEHFKSVEWGFVHPSD